MRSFLLSCGLLAAASGVALAGDVWVGNTSGRIDRHRPMGTDTVFPTLCTQISASVFSGGKLYLADSFGTIWSIGVADLSSQFFPQAFITNALAIHNGDLLSAGSDGKLRRISTTDGAVLSTVTIGGQVHALTVEKNMVYMGGHDTLIRRGSTAGPFAIIGACGGQVHSLAINGGELLAAAIDGKVYRINKATGQYITQWNLPAGMGSTQIAMDGAYLAAGGADGFLRWFNPTTGAVQFGTAICSSITALAIIPQCKADMDRTGSLNANDFQAYIDVWAAGSPDADKDGNGRLNANDFNQFMNAFAEGCH